MNIIRQEIQNIQITQYTFSSKFVNNFALAQQRWVKKLVKGTGGMRECVYMYFSNGVHGHLATGQPGL